MKSDQSDALLGNPTVVIRNHRNFLPEEWAKLATDKIISVGNRSDPVIVQQAIAFRDNIERVIAYYIQEAIKADRQQVTK